MKWNLWKYVDICIRSISYWKHKRPPNRRTRYDQHRDTSTSPVTDRSDSFPYFRDSRARTGDHAPDARYQTLVLRDLLTPLHTEVRPRRCL